MRRRSMAFAAAGLILLSGLFGCNSKTRTNSDQIAPSESSTTIAPSDAHPAPHAQVEPPTQAKLLEIAGAKLGGPDGLLAGGPPPDGIPPIDHPTFVTVAQVNWLAEQEPVGVLVQGDVARAYPLQILMWHEIVNDVVDGRHVTVTYCPLCNSVLAFDQNLDGQRLTFGTSGMLWRSDLVMYDRQTFSLWSQMEGRAIYGPLAEKKLQFIPVSFVSWGDFKKTYPSGQVLSRQTGHSRAYGSNPYVSYDSSTRPFLFDGTPDNRLGALERVLGLAETASGKPRAWSYSYLEDVRVERASDAVIFFFPGVASALDTGQISDGRDVGATGVFSPVLGDRKLTFEWTGSAVKDRETGSTWNVFGQATAGPLLGQQLIPLVKYDVFWFAWAAFFSDTELKK